MTHVQPFDFPATVIIAQKLSSPWIRNLVVKARYPAPLYQHLDTATQSGGFLHNTQLNPPSNDLFASNQGGAAGATRITDQNVLSITARIHKDFLP